MTHLNHKGYVGSVETDLNDNILYGKLLYIQDLVNYEAATPFELKLAFEEAVDEYLSDCAKSNQEPNKPFKGQFNVRVEPELHRELAVTAKTEGQTLNQYVHTVLRCHKHVEQFSLPETANKNYYIVIGDVAASRAQVTGGQLISDKSAVRSIQASSVATPQKPGQSVWASQAPAKVH